jgi:molecular chaperone DnaJ
MATAAPERDLYEILGVSPSADEDAIRRAFRTRARTLHPDVSDLPDAGARFHELAEAYRVLSKSETRLLYDRLGYRGPGNGRAGPRFAAEVRLGYFEAAHGVTRELRLPGAATCTRCRGGGVTPGSARVCPECLGEGLFREVTYAESGRLLRVEVCLECAGEGEVGEPCPDCRGEGRLSAERTVEVRIPPRTRDGDRIELDDVRVVVRVEPPPPEPRFVRYAAAVALVLAVALLLYLLLAG